MKSLVGRDRARYRLTRLSIPPVVTVHATFTAHGRRLPGIFPRFLSADLERYAPPSHSAGSYFEAPDKLWSFPLYVAFPRSEYDGHADSHLTHSRFSEVVSNPLLPLSFASSDGPPTFSTRDSTRPRRWRLSDHLYLLRQAPQWIRGKSGASVPSFWQLPYRELPRSGKVRCKYTSHTLTVPSGKVLRRGLHSPQVEIRFV
jgi:hypothetical protein